MAIPAMALLQQHDARRDILIEPAARRRSKLGGIQKLGAQSGRKTHRACLFIDCNHTEMVYNATLYKPGVGFVALPADAVAMTANLQLCPPEINRRLQARMPLSEIRQTDQTVHNRT